MPKILRVEFDDVNFYFVLEDGRRVGEAIVNFPLLASASEEQRSKYTLSHLGAHWSEIDEDISIEPYISEAEFRNLQTEFNYK